MVMSWLLNTMNEIGEKFMYNGTAKVIRDAAKEPYSNIDNTFAIFEIKSFYFMISGESIVVEYFNFQHQYLTLAAA
uniref:Uncharacterized protein n=1 Tax=Cajanus cajan TaxID=3821 RepID=A0A151TRW8_CAJCA|nr:LOW QUALITY PROTEIN: hypothetical protein KK1_008964 [Cajanus cajan]